MATHSVLPIIALWEEFIQQQKDGDIQAFARWIIKDKQKAEPPLEDQGEINCAPGTDAELKENEKAMLLIYRVGRLMEKRGKPIIKKIGFAKPHEYTMLAEIALLGNPNKKEIARKMLLENSTAVEITNRLVQRGFVKEINDPNDKRATRLIVTDKGMKKLYESYEATKKLHANFLDCLNTKERKELVKLLGRLEKFQSIELEANTQFKS